MGVQMEKRSVCIQKRDYQMLIHLFRWKCATTSHLQAKYYSAASTGVAYERLYKLQKNGFIKSVCTVDGKHHLWILTDQGFNLTKSFLGYGLEQDGFRSEHLNHDFWVSCLHQGDWCLSTPSVVEFFTEQELRRVPYADYPDWMPKYSNHRPDGYWKILDHLFALEVEISIKSPCEYSEFGDFYQRDKIHGVIWVVKTIRDAKYIYSKLEIIHKKRDPKHHFYLISDFVENGWQMKCVKGAKIGQSLASVFDGIIQVQSSIFRGSFFLLDTRKNQVNQRIDEFLIT